MGGRGRKKKRRRDHDSLLFPPHLYPSGREKKRPEGEGERKRKKGRAFFL